MRILMLQDWNRIHGGAEAYTALLRDALRAGGDQVRLLTSSAGSADSGRADYIAFGTEQKAAQVFLQVANPFAVAKVRQAIREFQPDVAWVNMFAWHLSPAALFALGSVPTLLYVSDYKLVCPLGSKLLPDGSLCSQQAGWTCYREGCLSLAHWLRDQPRYALVRRAVGRMKRVIACSAYVQEQIAELGINARAILAPVIAPPTDWTRLPSAESTFLFCGRLEREKGVDHVLNAFARLCVEQPLIQLRIAGRGSRLQSLERLAESLGIAQQVRFLGWQNPPQLDAEFETAWACVVPSTWAEPQGLVAVEAIVRGVPVIASTAGGLAEYVEHGRNGLLFSRGDENALLDCLRAIAQGAVFPTHSLSSEVVAAAADRFSVARHVARIRGVLQELITPSDSEINAAAD